MLRWLVLPVLVFACLVATVSAAAVRDRDHDRLPDRWERKHHLSTKTPNARRDPDHDRLANLREFRVHTNPRRRDTDRDGFSDRCELRKKTNPRKRRSHPASRCRGSRSPAPPGDSPPPSGGWPGESNTGVPPGIALTPSRGMTINTAGAVIDARDFSGPVVVNAPNVTIQNSYIHGGAAFAVQVVSGSVTVKDTTIDGADNCGSGVAFANFTALRLDISRCENGATIGDGSTVQDSWIHDLSHGGTKHTDGIQSDGPASNVTIRHNTIRSKDTSAIIMYTKTDAANHDWTIDGNLLENPDNIDLYCPRSPTTRIVVTNNKFVRPTAQFGHYTDACSVAQGHVTTWAGNVDANTGATVRPD